jgi:hypothetical protein
MMMSDLKQELEKQTNIPIKEQVLICYGKMIEGEGFVLRYGIDRGIEVFSGFFFLLGIFDIYNVLFICLFIYIYLLIYRIIYLFVNI